MLASCCRDGWEPEAVAPYMCTECVWIRLTNHERPPALVRGDGSGGDSDGGGISTSLS